MILDLSILNLVEIVLLGLAAGVLGGMLGVGGSVIMIPGLTFVLGTNQHLYQAAAMIANVAVSLPAARRHHKAGATVPQAMKWMLPSALVFVLVGVWASNLPVFEGKDGGVWLGRVLALFLCYVIYVNIKRFMKDPKKAADKPNADRNGDDPGSAEAEVAADAGIADAKQRQQIPAGKATFLGAIMGGIAGLLGIGGGAIATPMQQVLLGLPIKSCIANSSTIICISASLGAIYKNASLGQHGVNWQTSLIIAAILAPSCWVGGHLGAILTHKLPVRQVRLAFIGLMIVAMLKMAHLPWGAILGGGGQ